jgi:Icc-related predicted phosphoesterase
VKICAVADLHGRLPDIPECDVLVIAGDICPDIDWRHAGGYDLMKQGQTEWLGDAYREWEDKVPAEHIVATPGNHDWVDAFPDNCRSQMYIDQGFEMYDGPKMKGRWPKPFGQELLRDNLKTLKTFWFTPWVSHCGDWNYQAHRDRRRYAFDNIPHKLDLLVMHAPAHGVGDTTYSGEHAGCQEMRQFIQMRQPRHAVFGHIHEGQRYGTEYRLGGTKLYHVSMWGEDWKPRVFEI